MEHTTVAPICERGSVIVQGLFFSAALCWRGCVASPLSLKYRRGVLLHFSQATGHSFHFVLFLETGMFLSMCFEFLVSWNVLLPSFYRLRVILLVSICHWLSQSIFVVSQHLLHLSPASILHCQGDAFTVADLTRFMPNMLLKWAELMYVGFIWLKYSLGIFSCPIE